MINRATQFQAIGTVWDIQIQTAISDSLWAELLRTIDQRVQDFDTAYSRFRPDSTVSAIARTAGRHELPADGYKLLQFYDKLYEATGGNVTPLIGQTMVEAGYDATYSLAKQAMHQPPEWHNVITYDETSITVQQPVLLDFGAAGKGYLVDLLGSLLEATGIDAYLINAGGDIRRRSEHDDKIEVGLENPVDISEVIGIARLGSSSLCASSGSKRKWQDMTHIIDPVTLRSPDHILATWVMAADTMTADGLATALFFTEPGELMEQFSFDYALLDQDMRLQTSRGFPVIAFEAQR